MTFKAVRGREQRPAIKARRCCGCANPIEIKRVSRNTCTIGFAEQYFRTQYLENTLRSTAFAQDQYKLFDTKEGASPGYVTFAVQLVDCYNDPESANIMTRIVKQMIDAVMLNEVAVHQRTLSLSAVSPERARSTLGGTTLSSQTRKLLRSAGIYTLANLSNMTREELCQIPGMTTTEVARIGKLLAERGIMLRPTVVPIWH